MKIADDQSMSKTFRECDIDQQLLLPQDMREWLPENHLALFVADAVQELDLAEILSVYEREGRGQPPYHPRMMVRLLLYAYCKGRPSSRKIELATYEEVPYRVLAAGRHPDHDTIADFRKRHLTALAGLFLQVLQMCRKAGLVKLGHVALDGTKIKANASKHKAMSYERMCAQEKELEEEVARLLKEAAETDQAEDAAQGKGKRGDELPPELARRSSRLKKIKEAKAALEAQAREQAAAKAAEVQQKLAAREKESAETGRKPPGNPPQMPDVENARPEPKAQRNFTDPESKIMKDGASKSFEQAYNAQAAVDGEAQVIVAVSVTPQANDKAQLAPMLEKVQENVARLPEAVSADSGYFSEAAVQDKTLAGAELYVPPDRQRHGNTSAQATSETKKTKSTRPQSAAAAAMREKLNTPTGRALYKLRKAIVEPVFGQIKEQRGYRRFLLRGLENVSAEWTLIALTHNLLKLFAAKMA